MYFNWPTEHAIDHSSIGLNRLTIQLVFNEVSLFTHGFDVTVPKNYLDSSRTSQGFRNERKIRSSNNKFVFWVNKFENVPKWNNFNLEVDKGYQKLRSSDLTLVQYNASMFLLFFTSHQTLSSWYDKLIPWNLFASHSNGCCFLILVDGINLISCNETLRPPEEIIKFCLVSWVVFCTEINIVT